MALSNEPSGRPDDAARAAGGVPGGAPSDPAAPASGEVPSAPGGGPPLPDWVRSDEPTSPPATTTAGSGSQPPPAGRTPPPASGPPSAWPPPPATPPRQTGPGLRVPPVFGNVPPAPAAPPPAPAAPPPQPAPAPPPPPAPAAPPPVRPATGVGIELRRHGRARWHTSITFGVAAAVLVAAAAVVALVTGSGGTTTTAYGPSATATSTGTGTSQSAGGAAGGGPAPASSGPGTVTLSATGDIVLGNAPNALPDDDGRGMFDRVAEALTADLAMANLEQPLTEDTGVVKCSPEYSGKTCFAFRVPQRYAQLLRSAGIDLVNMANNHSHDFGAAGYRNTQAALDEAGVKYTGAPGKATVVEVNGVRVAVVGFAPYAWANDPTDLDGARALVAEAAKQADLVVVQAHLGAEGGDRTHVRPGTEMFLGENRGDPIRFAHTVIDAGADLVVGHGPHVMRAMEFHQGRLIAYSLGNFTGYQTLSTAGVVGVGGVLRVTLRGDGTFVDGNLVPTVMIPPGVPRPDSDRQALTLVRGLCEADFPSTGARLDDAGRITPP